MSSSEENGRTVVFPGELAASRPKAHIPGQYIDYNQHSPQVQTQSPLRVATATIADLAGSGSVTASRLERTVRFKALRLDAVLPARGTDTAAGYDLSTPEKITLEPGERRAIPLGFALAIPDDLHGRIESRSGLALKGLVVLTGVVDADYRGEVRVIMQNFSGKAHEFAAGDRVAQLVLRPTVYAAFEPVEELESTARGQGGFGSTGR